MPTFFAGSWLVWGWFWGGWGLLTGDVGEGCCLDVEIVCTYGMV